MGPNNFSVSGSFDGCCVSTGPNSLTESVFVLEGLDTMGPNNFEDSDGVAFLLDKDLGVLFL
jgi:hypothetical protein